METRDEEMGERESERDNRLEIRSKKHQHFIE